MISRQQDGNWTSEPEACDNLNRFDSTGTAFAHSLRSEQAMWVTNTLADQLRDLLTRILNLKNRNSRCRQEDPYLVLPQCGAPGAPRWPTRPPGPLSYRPCSPSLQNSPTLLLSLQWTAKKHHWIRKPPNLINLCKFYKSFSNHFRSHRQHAIWLTCNQSHSAALMSTPSLTS